MKLLLILLSLNISLSYAQKLKFGPEIGFNLINIETQKIGDNYQIGWHTGVCVEYELKKWFGISTGLYYTQKKQSFQEFETIGNILTPLLASQGIEGINLNTYSETNGRITLNNLQLPILAVIKHKNYNLKLGGYVGYLFNSRSKTNEVKNTPFVSVIDFNALNLDAIDPSISQMISLFLPPENETNFFESTSSSGLSSIDFGIKTEFTYHVNSIGFNASYVYGLTDYRSSNSNELVKNNSYFQFSVAYYFGKGTLKKEHLSKL